MHCPGPVSYTHLDVYKRQAKGEELDKINGLSLGADDYVTKPFLPLELVARVKAQLRRYKRYNGEFLQKEPLTCGGLVIDVETHQASLNGAPLSLTPTEFSLLAVLCENKGKVVSSEELFRRCLLYTSLESGRPWRLALSLWEKPQPSSLAICAGISCTLFPATQSHCIFLPKAFYPR